MRSIIFFCFLFAGISYVKCQVIIECPLFTAGTPYSYTYNQDFNSLATSGTSNTWTNNSTITGWYAGRTTGGTIPTYRSEDGSSNTGAIYSFGSTASSDRALGSIPSNSFTGATGSGKNYLGLLFKNGTTATIDMKNITYTGEQWRDGNNGTENLIFEYMVSSSIPVINSTSGWTALSSLNFIGPVAAGAGAAINGNAAANRSTLNLAVTISVASNEYIMLRWYDVNNIITGDQGLSIDDIAIAFEGGIDCYTLPVTLTLFDAAKSGDDIILSWTTQTEKDNAFFTLEKSSDAVSFSTVAVIDGAGTSTNTLHYSFTDTEPYTPVNYYRLKQTDSYGISTSSDIISIRNDSGGFTVSPNPATDMLYVNIPNSDENLPCSIIDLNGNIVLRTVLNDRRVDISGLSAGLYIIKCDVPFNTQNFFFSKQ